MPPFVGRKRLSPSPPTSTNQPKLKRARLTDTLDAETSPALPKARTFSLGSDSESSLSDIDSDEFEDVQVKHEDSKKIASNKPHISKPNEYDEHEDDDEDVEWEDAGGLSENKISRPIQDLQITIRKDDEGPDYGSAARAAAGKKGPSKREKLARVQTHQMHVQFLLWHNAIRNNWISDQKVQETLLQQLPAQIVKEVERWRRASGITVIEPSTETRNNTKKKRKSREKEDVRAQRDWGRPSSRLEPGKADMSNGDPIISFMKVLSAYWKKRFAVTSPGLRKRGYGTKVGLKQDIASYRNDEHDPKKHGEKIKDIGEFRKVAKACEGSRDVGAQLFTALLRGLGIEARMVASLQPAGFGWTKAEQMAPKKAETTKQAAASSGEESTESSEESPAPPQKKTKVNAKFRIHRKQRAQPRRRTGGKDTPIDLDSEKEEVTNDSSTDGEDDNGSVVDITPSMPKARPSRFDRDLNFPIYWTEVISPVTQKILPVSPFVLASPVASTPEVLSTFEPRGAKADKARQVIAYVIAHSPDGTAKDVTVRYLRKKLWPGKTKGFRYPVEKVPIYDKRGRIKKYEDYDWFKHVMRNYVRSDDKLTTVDVIEDSADLVPAEPEKKVEADGDTQQSLKSSPDFCLERFLRREEALKPGAKPVRNFVSGKGDNLKEEPVYKRSDVERCLSAESWHKEGRQPKEGETPLKLVPVRAVTLTRKREAEEHQMRTGEKQMQGLYSWDQTEWIIPPPIKDGIIPKNSYGNIDCFVPSMIPKGAVHVPLRGTVRLCKKLQIDYAEAVVGFEFGNKMAVPVISGVIVASENDRLLRDAWSAWNEEQKKKEETKMEKLVLDLWRKFIIGLRIRERVQDTYGNVIDVDSTKEMTRGKTKEEPIRVRDDDEGEEGQSGGLFPEKPDDEDFGGGFLLEEDLAAPEELVMEEQISSQKTRPSAQHSKPISTSLIVGNSSPRLGQPVVSHDSEDSLLSEHDSESDSELKAPTTDAEVFSDDAEVDQDGEDDIDDDYTPFSRASRVKGAKANRITSLTNTPTSTRKAPIRSAARKQQKEEINGTETPKRSGRGARDGSKVVTSPYFDN